MDIQENIMKMKEFQNIILDILDGDNFESKYSSLTEMLNSSDHFQKDKHKIKSLLLLIINIANNHHRCPDFNNKIGRILLLLKLQIKQFFSNDDIFHFFKGNKRLLLFLIEESILQIDDSVASQMIDDQNSKFKFKEYFFPELKSFIDKDECNQIMDEMPDDFEEKRRIGENDNYICKLIQNDSVEDFISYVNRTNFSLKTEIKPTLFETNQFLLKNRPTLIEYSVFFGSIQIFRYLDMNQVELKPSLWLYAIHGSNAEMIHLLEEKEIDLPSNWYEKCLEESIKCHHNDIATYINDNLIIEESRFTENNNFFKNIHAYSFHYYNYFFLPEKIDQTFNFYYACKYNYFDIVDYFLNETIIDINAPKIHF